MARIDVTDAQAWAESTKLAISALDTALDSQVETQVLTRLQTVVQTSAWVDTSSTPAIVKSIIAMLYVSWVYDRQYSEDQESGNDYAALLRASAESLIQGILNGTIELPGVTVDPSQPAFYPTDASSALDPTPAQPHLGPEHFQTGMVF